MSDALPQIIQGGMGVAVSNWRLANAVSRAGQLGVELLWGNQGIEWTGGKLTVAGRTVEAGLIVAADGHNSTMRRAVGLDAAASLSCRYAYRRHYSLEPWDDHTDI